MKKGHTYSWNIHDPEQFSDKSSWTFLVPIFVATSKLSAVYFLFIGSFILFYTPVTWQAKTGSAVLNVIDWNVMRLDMCL